LVKPFFGEVTERRIVGDSSERVAQLERAIRDYLDQRRKTSKPFVWSASADLNMRRV